MQIATKKIEAGQPAKIKPASVSVPSKTLKGILAVMEGFCKVIVDGGLILTIRICLAATVIFAVSIPLFAGV